LSFSFEKTPEKTEHKLYPEAKKIIVTFPKTEHKLQKKYYAVEKKPIKTVWIAQNDNKTQAAIDLKKSN